MKAENNIVTNVCVIVVTQVHDMQTILKTNDVGVVDSN